MSKAKPRTTNGGRGRGHGHSGVDLSFCFLATIVELEGQAILGLFSLLLGGH